APLAPATKGAVKRFQRRFGGRVAPLHTARLIRGFGEIVITAPSPQAQLFLDGRYVGRGQRKVLRRIPVGRHRVHIVINGKRSPHRDLTLVKDKRAAVSF
ncbi:MAG: hypothetical protein KC503_41590, partial [Myxococcales bacterium]|nr:hypothetical protein [Myxococcales bacterium]